MNGLADGAAAAGYDLLLASRAGKQEADLYAELYRSRRVDGLVILDVQQEDERVAAARRHGVRYVCWGRPADDSPYVAFDAMSGTVEALAHLIVLGHERIGLLTPPLELAISAEQDAGYRAALDEAGIAFDEQLIMEGGSTEAEAYAAATDLLGITERPTAILAGSAALGFGTMHAAHDAGLQLGHDLALVVFDDSPAAAHVAPPLTAVRQPAYQAGRELAQLLVGVVERREEQRAVLLQTQLIVRQSCGRGLLHR